MKALLPVLALALLPFAAHSAAPADLYRCQLTQAIPGYSPEILTGLIAPSDMVKPSPGQLLVYPQIHLARGNTGVDAVVYGFHDEEGAGSRLLIQLIDGKNHPVSDYQKDPQSMKVEYTRERDQARFELRCDRA